MRRILTVAIVVALAGAALLLAPQRIVAQRASRFERESVNGRDVVAREVIVKFRQAPQASDLAQLRADGDADDLRTIGRTGALLLRSRSRSAASLTAALTRRPDVVYAEPNFIVRMISEPNDPRFPELWGLRNLGQAINGLPGVPGADIHVVPAWDLSLGSTSNVVAVIDTGIDYTHPDLAANMWSAPAAFSVNVGGFLVTCAAGTHGFNAIARNCDPMDDEDHGTHVAGTIGATGDNGQGVVGINWTARLMAIKFIDATGYGTTEDAIAAVEFAIAVKQHFAGTSDANIRVLSNSWGGPDFSQALLDEVYAANDADMLFVAGAGNDGFDNDIQPFYPASFEAPNVVSVAATDNTDSLAWFSNYGASTVHLGAPGVDILSTTIGNHYAYLSGTSMATPHVSGAAALVLSECGIDTAALKDTLLGSVDPAPDLAFTTTSGGRLNVHSALYSCIAPPQTPTGLTAHGNDARVLLSWSAALGATRYNVKRSLTPGGPYSSIAAAVHATSYTDTGLINGTTYYYVVSAGNSQGESGDSNEASATAHIPPDVIVSSFTIPVVSGSGSTMSVSVTTKNQGAGVAGPSTTSFYLSDNSVLDTSDTFLTTQAVPQLGAGAVSSASLSIVMPAVSTGSHYLIARADADDVLDESSEANNNAVRLIQMGPDLSMSAFTVPGNGAADSSVVVTDTTRNQGGGAATGSVTRFYLSLNSVLDSSDTPIGSRSVPALDPSVTNAATTTLMVPASTPAGAYYLIAKADADDAVPETSETNNSIARSILIGGDLVVTSFTVPSKAGAGATIVVSDTTTNQGGGGAPATSTRFYLSTNATLEAGDTQLPGGHAVPALAAGAADSSATSLTVPALTAGTYYLIAKADDDNAVVESRETNNTLVRSISIGGDLVVTTLTVPTTAGPGGAITVTDSTVNQGGGLVAPTTTRFYLSTNTVIDGADTPIGSRSVAALDAGVTNSGSTTVTIPASTPAGTYYLVASADDDHAAVESNETNNTLARSISIGGDLVVTPFTVPATGGAGSAISVTDTTVNQGGGTVGPTTTRFYWSANSLLDAGDTPIGNRTVAALGAGLTSSGSTTVTIPASAPAGTSYIIAEADADDAVAETSEANNTVARSILIGGDLAVTTFTVPAKGGAGSTISVTDTTANQGGGAVPATVTRFYFSANGVLDADDTLLPGGRSVAALGPGAASGGSTVLTLPPVTAGTYYLIAKADDDNAVLESRETNNTLARSISIGSDLQVSALTAPTKAAPGTSIVLGDTTTNQGGGDSPASVTAFYLSTSSTLDATDVVLDGSRAVPQLGPGLSSMGSTSVTIPAGTAPGTFYIIAKADGGNAVPETSELNNTRSRSIVIGPDLAFLSLSLSPVSVPAGAALVVTDNVTNQGSGVAAPSTTRFYLSINGLLDASDVALVPGRTVSQLAGGASSSGSTSVTIPSSVAPGTYYVLAQADGDGTVAESSETNNVSIVRPIQVTP